MVFSSCHFCRAQIRSSCLIQYVFFLSSSFCISLATFIAARLDSVSMWSTVGNQRARISFAFITLRPPSPIFRLARVCPCVRPLRRGAALLRWRRRLPPRALALRNAWLVGFEIPSPDVAVTFPYTEELQAFPRSFHQREYTHCTEKFVSFAKFDPT